MRITMNDVAIQFDAKLALAQFQKRFFQNLGKQIDNSKLYAGSPMTYYCRYCGEKTQVLPEAHMGVPRTVCVGCEPLQLHGLAGEARKNAQALCTVPEWATTAMAEARKSGYSGVAT